MGLAKTVKLDGRDHELSFRGIIGMGGELSIKSKRTNRRCVLITGSVREECLIRNIESENAVDARIADGEGIFSDR